MLRFFRGALALLLVFALIGDVRADLSTFGASQPLSHSVANSFEQTTDIVTDLRGFVGTVVPSSIGGNTGTQVFVRGLSAPGDGGGGVYYWNASSSAADNGRSVIKPTSLSGAGRWLLLMPAAGAPIISAADLAASPVAKYTLGVWRYDSVAGLLFYMPSTNPCPLNSGAGDGTSQVPSADSKCWLAWFNGFIDTRQFKMSGAAANTVNLAACSAATAAAYALHLPLVFGGGLAHILPGCDVHDQAKVSFLDDTWLVLDADGPALGSRRSPGAPLQSHNANDVKFASLQVDLNNHHGVAFINRAGMHVDVRGLKLQHPRAGSYVDVMAVTDTVTTVNSSTAVSSTITKVARAGMVVTDSLGCIKPLTQVASVDDASSTLVLSDATNPSGCGAGDVLSAYGLFNDGGYTVASYMGFNGAYYGVTEDVDVRVTVDTLVVSYISSTSFTVADATGIVAMTENVVTMATWASKVAQYTLTSKALIAPGQPVCFDGMTPSVYNGCYIAAQEGTYGNKVAVVGIPIDPGGSASGFGKGHYGGSFVENNSPITGILPFSWVTAVSGNTVTINTTPASLTAGNALMFTTGGVGISFTGTGTSENPNVQTVGRGKMMGFAIGTNFYRGGNGRLHDMDHTYTGLWGVVVGGNGGGLSSQRVTNKVIVQSPYLEFQGSGTGIWYTSDSRDGIAGEAGGGVANFSSPRGPDVTDREILNDGDSSNHVSLGLTPYSPTFTCASGGPVLTYTNQTGNSLSARGVTSVFIEIQANNVNGCAISGINVPIGHTPKSGPRQACVVENQSTPANTTLQLYGSSSRLSFNSAPTNATDNILAQCTYVDQ